MRAKTIVLMICFLKALHGSDEPLGILGGTDNTGTAPGYAALISVDGTLIELGPSSFPSTTGAINSVAINSSGVGMIGGRNNPAAYAAFVTPDGTLTQLSGSGFPSTSGSIADVAINNSGAGIIGGKNLTGSGPAYAALVASNGTLTGLNGSGFPSTTGTIRSVSINNSGVGLIGGIDQTETQPGYAALVAPNGTLTQLGPSSFPSIGGNITSVAINNSGVGLIGGIDNTGSQPAYAALVAPNGTLTQLSGGGFPNIQGTIEAVALNDAGFGIIGGADLTGTQAAYAALVAPNGTLTQLGGAGFPSTSGEILAVAINNSGAGIIGGGDFTGDFPAYAALVASDGTLTSLSGGGFPSTSGEIFAVAINDAGVGLIGGQNFTGDFPAYAALVAPDGTLTQLTSTNFPNVSGGIGDVSMVNLTSGSNSLTPSSIGSYLNAINTQLAATYALEAHLTARGTLFSKKEYPNDETHFVADAEDSLQNTTVSSYSKPNQQTKYCLWLSPFGESVHQKAQGPNPSLTNAIAGALTGFDYNTPHFLIGGAVGYAFDYVHYGSNVGHGTVQEELACLYGAFKKEHFWIDVAFWGGLYQLYNKRHTLSFISSTTHTHGYLFTPHLEIASPWNFGKNYSYSIEPFLQFDWVNSWQNQFTEKGSSGLNLVLNDQYTSLLRSEIGLRFYEELNYNWGKILFQEKLSYVNQAPFQADPVNTFFVASASTFPIAIGNSTVQNLGGVALYASFLPSNQKRPYFSLGFQGEFGSSYQSYFLNLEIGKDF